MTSGRGRRAVVAAALTLGVAVPLAGCGTEAVHGRAMEPEAEVGTVVEDRGCPGSDFECITLAVPADHVARTSANWPATFALHRGTKDSRGVLVTATGGPGSSGIAVADQYFSNLPPEITDHYDVVFFDQRGIGRSHPFRCDRAVSAAPSIDAAAGPQARDAFASDARDFAAACFAEAGIPAADAGLFGTRQAVEDLEQFRRWLGADRLILYGESYGTQFQQAYAAAHPDHVAELLLDGVVDLQTPVLRFQAEAAHAVSSVLAATLTSCDRDPACAGDAPGSSAGAYDALAAELARAPLRYAYPLANGRAEPRMLTLEDLQAAASASVSDEAARAELLRALNAATDGDAVPLARLAANSDGADPATGAGSPDPGFSDALYLAVECQDYRFVPPGGSARGQLDVWLDTARQLGLDRERLGSGFYGDLPCLFWPRSGDPAPPLPAPAAPRYPVLLLTADTDPNTPTQNASRLLARLGGSAALVSQTGGPHVVFGRGDACVDDLVTRVITTGRLPAVRVTTCPGDVTTGYEPNPPSRPELYRSAGDTSDAVLAAVLDDPAYAAWTGDRDLTIGCDAGGTARYRMGSDSAVHVRLRRCSWTRGVPVDGTVTVADSGYGDARLSVTLPFATLARSSSGHVTGVFRGRPVS
ncbi:MAG TPA: alpha/beta fold hydrolase [Blastococcus sp.]|nr:alpha/beta fold hydrolase [Blastococcus sp.]